MLLQNHKTRNVTTKTSQQPRAHPMGTAREIRTATFSKARLTNQAVTRSCCSDAWLWPDTPSLFRGEWSKNEVLGRPFRLSRLDSGRDSLHSRQQTLLALNFELLCSERRCQATIGRSRTCRRGNAGAVSAGRLLCTVHGPSHETEECTRAPVRQLRGANCHAIVKPGAGSNRFRTSTVWIMSSCESAIRTESS